MAALIKLGFQNMIVSTFYFLRSAAIIINTNVKFSKQITPGGHFDIYIYVKIFLKNTHEYMFIYQQVLL